MRLAVDLAGDMSMDGVVGDVAVTIVPRCARARAWVSACVRASVCVFVFAFSVCVFVFAFSETLCAEWLQDCSNRVCSRSSARLKIINLWGQCTVDRSGGAR
jgi:hypothetical protein